jgi:microcystin-dependent protein
MSYQVRFTDTTKTPITVEDQTLNVEKSIGFVGKNYAGYSQVVGENFLHLLENFARSSPPSNPIAGQLWYDTTVGINNQLKLYDGTSWVAAGNVKKSTSQPVTAVIGDLWVDTDNQQLFLYNGSGWVLVGPQFSDGQETGARVELISDSVGDNIRSILTLLVKGERVAIISERDFTPKAVIEGFTNIKQGLNLSTRNFNSSATGNKYWGVSEKAESLIIGSVAVAAANFLRSDAISTTNFGLNIRNNAGVSIGGDLALSIGIENNSAVVYNKISGSSIDFKLKSSNATPIVLRIDSNQRIGVNKTNPDEALDVAGSIKTNEKIIVTGTEDATSLINGSISTAGGVSIAKNLRVGNELTVGSSALLRNTLPQQNNSFDLGSQSVRWNNVFANNINATNISGSFTGFLTGNISGSAISLVNSATFSLGDRIGPGGSILQASDVVSSGEAFNGTQGNVVLTGIISSSFIANKTEATDSFLADEFIVNRGGVLRKLTKQTFLRNVPTIPTGAIFPFAGNIIPIGYLLCDGSEQLIANYPELFSVIQYSYKPLSLLTGVSTFALPDLRGRFPLGRDDMSNTGGSNPADRVTDVAADTIGLVGGASSVTLTRNNLPEHVHNLKGNAGSQFYAFAPRTGTPPDTNAEAANGLTAIGSGQLMVDSGRVFMDDLPSSTLNVPINITNHYQTINYIIFTGRIA